MTHDSSAVPRVTPLPDPLPSLLGHTAPARAKLLYFPAPVAVAEAVGPSHTLLLFEFILLFAVLPLVFFFGLSTRIAPLPVLWGASLYCLVILLRDSSFDRRQLWNAAPLRSQLPQILSLFAAGVVVITVLVHQYAPHLFLLLARTYPRSLALIMLLYPAFSVVPQGIVYRAYLFHRYRPLLHPDPNSSPWLMILVSAAAFSLVHIIFRNWIAPVLTFPGGVLFACRYSSTRSLCTSNLEHTLYGWLLFVVGLGEFFGVHVL